MVRPVVIMSGLCPTTGEGVTQVVPLSIEYWYVTPAVGSSKQIMPWLPLIPTATKLVGALRVSSGAEGRWNALADRSPCPWLGGNLSFPEGSAERAEEKIPTTVSASRATLGNEEAPNRVPQIKNETRTGGAHLCFLTERKSDPKLAVRIPEPAQFLSRAPKTICTWCRWLWPDRRSRWDAVALLNASLNERMLIIYLILILPVRANNVHVDYRVPGWHGDARQVKVVRFHLLKDLLGGT